MMRKIKFIEGEIYHIYNRGVEKRDIFLENKDYFRFIHDLFEFNDEEPATLLYYKKPFIQSYETKSHRIDHKRKLMVEIIVFTLMPNHFHLLLRPGRENAISEFMHRLGVGYSMYFNQKYERSGSLFQGPYKAVLVEKDSHFIHLPYYIHLNPLDLKFPEWRDKEIKDYKEAIKFLENYRWGSFQDYIGKKNFPSVTQREFLNKFFGGPEQYKKDILKWLKEMDLEEIKEIILE
jgi:putative transposase